MNFIKVFPLSLLALAFLAPGVGALNNRRHSHAVTLLPDGNILITGGTLDTVTVTASVEMYDMASNAYIAWIGGLTTARSSHTATLMSDGRVLVAGGFGDTGQSLDALEICNPITRTCATAGVVMATARGGHTATLLSRGPRAGQVLLCGGRTGTTGTSITENCETFNPATPSVLAAGAMVSPREGHTATLLRSGKVFVTGGRRRNLANSLWIYEPMNEMYDPATGAGVWTPVAALLHGRVNHTATALNSGKIMIAGGYNAANTLYCKADEDSLEDECWHIKYDPLNVQNAGNQGYLDGAEFFDQNGARVVLQETTYGELPYRVAQHTAVLEPDGRWRIHGGYGNIYPTFFTDTPALASDTVIDLTPVAGSNNTATIDATSLIKFPLNFELSRPVSGRLVNADAFISLPTDPASPSFTLDTADFYLPRSTAPVDASPVGMLLGESYKPGDFNDIVRLQNPSGTAEFSKQTVTSGDSPLTYIDSSVLTLLTSLEVGDINESVTGSVTTDVNLTLPDIYRDVVGVANVVSGQITDNGDVYYIDLEQSGSATFDITDDPTSCDADEDTCVFTAMITFTGLVGKISNQTTDPGGSTLPSGTLNAAGDQITLELELDYIAREVSVLDREATYAFSRSTMVIRGMILSSQLSYNPKSNAWGDLTDSEESPAMATPSFNHTALLTPAADTVILGGRNCEFNPDADCLRAAMRFSTATVSTILTPVYRDSAGSGVWPEGEKLNSKRAFHTSNLLPDGRILACGGSDGARPLATCELMDPQTKEWALTGSMNSPRANHTATLLPNGAVLAAGGITPYGIAVSSAEIYYPDTQRWVPASSMSTPRQLHTATLTPDGNVLVTGGATLNAYSDSAELYISSAAHWLNAGSMTYGRSQHTATLLKNGNVLVAGGVNGLGAMNQTEVYDYTLRTFSAGPSLNTARYAHTANQLRDGNVIVTGGSDNTDSLKSCEIYDGTDWTETADLNLNRANHRSVLLPNGKLMVTGGEMSGTAQYVPEGFSPDYRSWSLQGEASGRTHHTSLITRDNLLVTIGGWSGGGYLDTTETINFNFYPDMSGLEAETTRQAVISTGTVYFDNGNRATLLSDTSNFHGISEASGGGAGPANASFHNPRIYLQQIDNPSGFMADLSTRVYSWYGGPNSDWEKTLSSITIITPNLPEAPHGWYHMRVAAAGVFSEGYTVQITTPRPTGTPTAPTGTVQGTNSIAWTWGQGTVKGADGYSIHSATDNVFISTATFAVTANHTQTGLAPNTAASIMVAGYNQGGNGSLSKSDTYYTLAAVPTPLNITAASFETVGLEWSPNGNSGITIYEVSMSPTKTPKFSDPLDISTPVPFSVNHTSTSTEITQLSADQSYDFRVSAKNGAGEITAFSNYVTTTTVGSVNNFTGEALSDSEINWSWDEALGADYYELYDITTGTATAVLIGSPTDNNLSQTGLLINKRYQAAVGAVKTTTTGLIRGPVAWAPWVYTLTVQPLPGTPNVFTNVSTGSFAVNWITNGNSTWTVYRVAGSLDSAFSSSFTFETTNSSVTFASLSPNIRYYARLTPVNGDDIEGTTLDLGSKYTLAKVPASLNIVDISMSEIKLKWDTDGNSTGTIYEVRSSTSSDFSDPIKTHIYFSELYTSTTAFVNGLLTFTPYYFDVAACNGEGVSLGCTGVGVTARKRAVAAKTLSGPGGAPAGSVGGTSDPSKAVTISGALPNNREVAMYAPAGSFASATAIAISSFSPTGGTNRCGYLPGGSPVEVAVFSQDGSQPQEPVTLTLNYSLSEANGGITANAPNIVLARYNPETTQCLPLETKVNTGPRTITATLNHFSLFQVMVRVAASNLDNVLIYPNPFYVNRGHGFVTIDKIPANSKVRIYTLSGDKIWEAAAGATGVIIWKGLNKSGYLVASGIYLAVIDSSSGKKVFKLAVER